MIRRGWFLILACAVLVLVVGVLVLVHLRLRSADSRLPERGTRTIRVGDCPAEVEVIFDRQGSPHIRTGSQSAMWFAQGYVHARDRFFQMELARRTAEGSLAEVFGEDVLESDRKIRTLRLAATARRQLTRLRGDHLAVLEWYAAGVNSALAEYGRWIAPEIWLVGLDPEPWRPEDSLSIAMLLQFELSWAMGEELQRGLQLTRLGRERALDLWGWSEAEARAWIPPGKGVRHPFRGHEPITPPMAGFGSNAWAVSGERSASGRPLLASDPHLGVQMPGTFAAIHLEGADLHVAGLSIPGTPGVVIGHTEQVAWGLAVAMVDDQDLFILTLDESGAREFVDGRWQPLRTITENIEVRWQENPELVKVRMSVHGPVVREQRDETLALSWAAHQGPSVLTAVLEMNRAQTVEQAAAAWREVSSPALHMVAADTRGVILHQVLGAVPQRGQGAGRLPSPGTDSRWAWNELEPLSGLRTVDPEDGFIVAANQDVFAEGNYPERQRYPADFAPPWRARRISQVLAGRGDWTVGGFVGLQGDVVSGRAIALLKLLRPDLERSNAAAAKVLMNWDGRMTEDSAGALVFEMLMSALTEAVGGDEALREGLPSTPLGPEELLRLLAGGLDEAWWNNVAEPGVQSRAEMLARVLAELDSSAIDGTWGDRHTITFDHPLTGAPGIGWLFADSWNRGPYRLPGSTVTVNAQAWDASRPFAVTTIPAARFVADVGAWDESLLMLPVGQSGRPWSVHYADQIQSWISNRPQPFAFSRQAVDASATGRLVIRPDPGAARPGGGEDLP
jgi:penicillin amidase